MNTAKGLKLSQRFFILIVVFTLGFAFFGAWSFKTLNDLKINGSLYQRIVQGKDLVADILPPPEYILESYLTTLQLANEIDKEEQGKLIEKLQSLKKDYDDRYEYWSKENLGNEIQNALLKQAHQPASELYDLAFNTLIPAVQHEDKTGISSSMVNIRRTYEIHRKAINQVVELTNKRNDFDENFAKEQIKSASLLLLMVMIISMTLGIYVAIVNIRWLKTSIGTEPGEAVSFAEKMANGEITLILPVKSGDNFSILAKLESMRKRWTDVVMGLRGQAHIMSSVAASVSGNSHTLATKSDIQSESTIDIAASVEELSVSFKQVKADAEKALETVEHAGKIANGGADVVRRMTIEVEGATEAVKHSSLEMQVLENKIKEITGIAELIREISEQTNLLALNASIEAARAGDQGRGFAVVADEVRKLAERAAKATEMIELRVSEVLKASSSISIVIEENITKSGLASNMANETLTVMSEIQQASKEAVQWVVYISNAMTEQNSNTQSISNRIEAISVSAEENARAAQSLSDFSTQLIQVSNAFNHDVSFFKVSDTFNGDNVTLF